MIYYWFGTRNTLGAEQSMHCFIEEFIPWELAIPFEVNNLLWNSLESH